MFQVTNPVTYPELYLFLFYFFTSSLLALS